MDPVSVFRSYLEALQDPSAGNAFHRLHAPEAVLAGTDGACRAADIQLDEFARLHALSDSAQGLPRFADPVLLHSFDRNESGECVSWLEVQDVREGRTLIAAVGTKTIDGATAIGWAALSTVVRDWTYARGYIQSLADYPWLRPKGLVRPRALIDASYLRLFGRLEASIATLPDARFQCQMSTVCCRHEFEIALPPEAQLLIDAMPWETIRPGLRDTRLPRRPDGKLQLKSLDETCRFLADNGRCLVHQTLGRQPFGACCVFPVAFAQTPQGISAALSPICGAAREGAGPLLSDRPEDLRERLVHVEPRKPDGFRLAPALDIPWENFRDVEQRLCEILAVEEIPLRRRLHVGARLLGALRAQETPELQRWISEPAGTITPELRTAIHGMLRKILGWDRPVLRSLPSSIPAELPDLEIADAATLSGVLRHTLFSKTFSYRYDLTSAFNLLIVLYLLALLMQRASSHSLSGTMWRELGALGVHGLLAAALDDPVPEGFRQIFGTADFGLWMLSA